MIEVQKPDGVIEIKMSSCTCCPPGERGTGGMHTNAMSSWWRAIDEWHRIPRDVGMHEVEELAESVESCQEFEKLVADDDV